MNELIQILGGNEARAEAKFILHALGVSYEEILTDKPVPEAAYEIARKRAKTGAPLQHLLGVAYFMDLKFKVNENTLIPRDETEILVLEAKKLVSAAFASPHAAPSPVKILDIGTGTGIIPISLGKIFGNKIEALGVDISTSALEVAIENAQSHLAPNIALFRKSDLFSNVKETFDIIISNPPYIPLKEKEGLQSEVLFEPESALFAPDEAGVEFYEKIISAAPAYLNPGGHILFELGINQAPIVEKMLLEKDFSDIKIIRDLAGIERVITASNM